VRRRHATGRFDPIPRGGGQISPLGGGIKADEHWVGSVEGLILEDDAQVGGFVVRAGHHGMHHYVIVSIAMIARMVSDLIVLRIDRAVFRALPTADGTLGDDDPPSTLRRIEHRIADAAQVVADRFHPAASRRR